MRYLIIMIALTACSSDDTHFSSTTISNPVKTQLVCVKEDKTLVACQSIDDCIKACADDDKDKDCKNKDSDKK